MASPAVLRKQIKQLQKKARTLLEQGLPIHAHPKTVGGVKSKIGKNPGKPRPDRSANAESLGLAKGKPMGQTAAELEELWYKKLKGN